MTRQKVATFVGVVLAFLCVARPGLAQTQATNATQPSRGSVCRRPGPAGE